MSIEMIEECIEKECLDHTYTFEDYEASIPRWCKGCGDHGILSCVQRLLRDDQIDPESVVCVSGIGCSSRFPHYLKTYGFHGLHGRALPVATGVALARPDVHVLVTMGDGDCFSIGAGHWVHGIRYNVDLTVLVFDNEIYALTKKQASPTSRQGASSNTTPYGAYLKPLNPLSVILGITNRSFLAQTATWLPNHMEATLKAAWEHKGLSFVRILQYCPVFTPNVFGKGGQGYNLKFLQHANGIPVDPMLKRYGPIIEHNPGGINDAQAIATQDEYAPIGLLYQDKSVPAYVDVRRAASKPVTPTERVDKLEGLLDTFAI